MPLAFAVAIGVSLPDRSREAAQDRAEFDALTRPSLGALAMAAE